MKGKTHKFETFFFYKLETASCLNDLAEMLSIMLCSSLSKTKKTTQYNNMKSMMRQLSTYKEH